MKDQLNNELEKLRVDYQSKLLDKGIEDNPIDFLKKWLQEAIESACLEPNAFTLSTIKDGRPRSRVLLIKGVDDEGLYFYTNYQSAKGDEIAKNPMCAANFLWLPLNRQIRIEGEVVKASPTKSDAYFSKRPRGSQLGAHASHQSQEISSREKLENQYGEVEKKFDGLEVKRPENWGGYILKPNYVEFWQGRGNRLHDRISYEWLNQAWVQKRLQP